MSTAGRLRNGIASNVFVYHNYNVYVRERPSDPESFKKMFGLFGEGDTYRRIEGRLEDPFKM